MDTNGIPPEDGVKISLPELNEMQITVDHIRELRKSLRLKFSQKVCEELHADCGLCKAQILIGSLNWYEDWIMEQDFSVTKEKKPRKEPKHRSF